MHTYCLWCNMELIHSHFVSLQSRQIDAEMIEMQGKLKKTIAHYQKKIQGYQNTILKQTQNQNQNREV